MLTRREFFWHSHFFADCGKQDGNATREGSPTIRSEPAFQSQSVQVGARLGAPVTIRELLHHTSGLRDQWLGRARAVLARGDLGLVRTRRGEKTLGFLDSLGERQYSPK